MKFQFSDLIFGAVAWIIAVFCFLGFMLAVLAGGRIGVLFILPAVLAAAMGFDSICRFFGNFENKS